MKITKLTRIGPQRYTFHLNVGGFTIKNCQWYPSRRQIRFPRRYDQHGGRHDVVFVYGMLVRRLRDLLNSGQLELPRDRRPCTLRIRIRGRTREMPPWVIFSFSVRGFTILGCRWQSATRSIQLPVSYFFDAGRPCWRKRRVVCAFGAHINRLRRAVEQEYARF